MKKNFGFGSKKKVNDDQARTREKLYDILSDNLNDILMMFSFPDLQLLYVTPNMERVLGIPLEEAMQNVRAIGVASYSDISHLEREDLLKIPFDHPVNHESERINPKTGEHTWFLETLVRTKIDGEERLVVILTDKTGEHDAARAMQDMLDIANAANAAKSTFLSNMSHDIRTPMNAIMGLATLLNHYADSPVQVREYTAQIMSASKHLLGIINDVLDMSKLESGKTTLQIGAIDLAQIISNVSEIMRPQIQAKKQTFTIRRYDVRSEYLLGDQLRVNQILINILSNASKFTPENGTIEMTIREMEQVSLDYSHIQFIVKDNGIGMPEDYLEHIFQPFTTEKDGMTNKEHGTGLGMAITQNLVNLMGGTIRVESRVDEGTTVTVDLELRLRKLEQDKEFWVRCGIKRALIIDDDELVCTSDASMMEKAGLYTDYAMDTESAFERIKTMQDKGFDYQLVIYDWDIAGERSLEVVSELRKVIPKSAVLLINSAADWNQIKEECIEAGVNGYLYKPLFISSLKNTVMNVKEEIGAPVEQEAGNSLEGRHFLAAEDNDLNAEILVELLSMIGVSCDIAVNGQEALTMFEASEPGTYDLILMDIQMPVMNGYHATRAIRQSSHPSAQTIPIVAMTANAFADDIREALTSGMNAHLSKPVEIHVMEKVLSDILAS